MSLTTPVNSGFATSPIEIAIGTANWGAQYGIANAVGVPTDQELRSILSIARAAGIGLLDTAPSYGNAEERIGALATDFAIITKFKAGAEQCSPMEQFHNSQQRLRSNNIKTFLLHDWDSVHRSTALRAVQSCVAAIPSLEEAPSIGVSAYELTSEDLVELEIAGVADIQVPMSPLDIRHLCWDSRPFVRQARSIFLQGLLISPRPVRNRVRGALLSKWFLLCSELGAQPLALACSFAKFHSRCQIAVAAFDSSAQAEDFLECWFAAKPLAESIEEALLSLGREAHALFDMRFINDP